MRPDAILVVSFGGPESPDEVLPFLESVTRGRGVPAERLLAVAGHYHHFGGRSPINDETRALITALKNLLKGENPPLPVYWGNRNWKPWLSDTIAQMSRDGIRRAAAFVTSAYSSWSGCRQYLDAIERARQEAGAGAPEIHKLRAFFDHPGFIEAVSARTREALDRLPVAARGNARLIFTAHSIPVSMARACDYEVQLREAMRLVGRRLGPGDHAARTTVAWQSRSGAPEVPWLEPDLPDVLRDIGALGRMAEGMRAGGGAAEPGADGAPDARNEAARSETRAAPRADSGNPPAVVIVPIGFVADHMEVVYDLDVEAAALCRELGITMVRARTAGDHPAFVAMIRELALEEPHAARRLSALPARPDPCASDCCPAPARPRGVPAGASAS